MLLGLAIMLVGLVIDEVTKLIIAKLVSETIVGVGLAPTAKLICEALKFDA